MYTVINIDENVYTRLLYSDFPTADNIDRYRIDGAVRKGTPLPQNATNGDIIKAMFQNVEVLCDGYESIFVSIDDRDTSFDVDWWNAPYKYKAESEER